MLMCVLHTKRAKVISKKLKLRVSECVETYLHTKRTGEISRNLKWQYINSYIPNLKQTELSTSFCDRAKITLPFLKTEAPAFANTAGGQSRVAVVCFVKAIENNMAVD